MSKKKRQDPVDEAAGAAEAEAADELVEPTESDEPVDLVVEETAEEEVDPLTAMTREKDEVFAQLQRVSADYQNYMRRAQHNQRESAELARADVIKTLLGVLDHFDHALSAEAEGDEAKALMDGVRIVHDELMKVLTQSGLGRVEPAVGDAFDPEQHEALMRQSAEGVEANHITAALQPGYRYGRRTLRAAKVAVAPESE